MSEAPLVRDALPGLAAEVESSLTELGRPDLAGQLSELRVAAVCPCEVEGCGSFYTARPIRRWFRRGRQIDLGDVVVDTIDGEIVFVEVLGRPEVRAALDTLRRPG